MISDPKHAVAEEHQSLWLLVASPAIWAAHFLVSYIIAALWCGMAGQRGAGHGVRLAIVGLAVVALVGIGITGWMGWRKHSNGDLTAPHDRDTDDDRHRFIGLATVLLSALSAVATIYVALSALVVPTCY